MTTTNTSLPYGGTAVGGYGYTPAPAPTPTPTAAQNTIFLATAQKFTMTAAGLRPSTQHFFTFNSVNCTANCQPFGGVLGANLITDSTGSLTFSFYYNSGLANSATSLTAAQGLVNQIAGNKQAVISNADNTSIAVTTITVLAGNTASNTFISNTQPLTSAASSSGPIHEQNSR